MNAISRSYFNIPDKVLRLKCIIQEHHWQIRPVLTSQQPVPQREKNAKYIVSHPLFNLYILLQHFHWQVSETHLDVTWQYAYTVYIWYVCPQFKPYMESMLVVRGPLKLLKMGRV